MTTRQDRALTQRILLINEVRTGEAFEYTILGSTKKTYTVQLKLNAWKCTCPDHSYRHLECKHILFVKSRVLGSGNWLEKAEQRIATGVFQKDQDVKQKDYIGDECGICLEEMEDGERVVYCKTICGKSIHQVCLARYSSVVAARCVYCRADWNE